MKKPLGSKSYGIVVFATILAMVMAAVNFQPSVYAACGDPGEAACSGGNGDAGADGGDGDDGFNFVIIVNVDGEDGDDGSSGGDGGQGSDGVAYTETINAPVVGDVNLSTAGGDGGDGGNGGNGGAGGDGADGFPALSPHGGNGGDGGSGGNGGNGGDGGNGGTLIIIIDADISGNLNLTSSGGQGGSAGSGGLAGSGGNGGNGADIGSGNGGNGGAGLIGGNGGDGGSGVASAGGTGGAGGAGIESGGNGGDGGNGGSLLVFGFAGGAGGDGGDGATLGGDGGDGGNGGAGLFGGAGGLGGNGGDGTIVSGDGGDGGSGGAGLFSGAGGSNGNSGGDSPILPVTPVNGADGAVGTAGSGGDINLTVNATITGGVNLDAGEGSIDVLLNNGAGVGGTINAIASGLKTLTFNMSTTSTADYDAALAALIPANASGGMLVFNGETYTWSNFDDLINQITFIVESSGGGGSNDEDEDDDKKKPSSTEPVSLFIPVTGGWLWIGENITLAAPAWNGDIPVTVLEPEADGSLEVYEVALENVTSVVQLDIPGNGPLPTIDAYFVTTVEQTVFSILPDGTETELPTTCTPQADGTFVCYASYTPSGSEDSLHPVICLHG